MLAELIPSVYHSARGTVSGGTLAGSTKAVVLSVQGSYQGKGPQCLGMLPKVGVLCIWEWCPRWGMRLFSIRGSFLQRSCNDDLRYDSLQSKMEQLASWAVAKCPAMPSMIRELSDHDVNMPRLKDLILMVNRHPTFA